VKVEAVQLDDEASLDNHVHASKASDLHLRFYMKSCRAEQIPGNDFKRRVGVVSDAMDDIPADPVPFTWQEFQQMVSGYCFSPDCRLCNHQSFQPGTATNGMKDAVEDCHVIARASLAQQLPTVLDEGAGVPAVVCPHMHLARILNSP
jgi:hypothetical protein